MTEPEGQVWDFSTYTDQNVGVYPRVIVHIPSGPRHDSNNKNSWAKHVTNVDMTRPDGYAFEGTFLRRGKKYELPLGAHFFTFDMVGPDTCTVALYKVVKGKSPDDRAELVERWSFIPYDGWALEVRDGIAKHVGSYNPAQYVIDQIAKALNEIESGHIDRAKDTLQRLTIHLKGGVDEG